MNKNPKYFKCFIVVKNEDSKKAKNSKLITKILGYKMVVLILNPQLMGGWSIVELKKFSPFLT